MTKVRILFVIESLGLGGAERSLLNLLNNIDKDRFEIDLQVFNDTGILKHYLNKDIKLLSLPSVIIELTNPWYKCIYQPKLLINRLRYSFHIRKGKLKNAAKAVKFWQLFADFFNENEEYYDYAIAYSQGIPTFYVVDKVKARKKFTWLNVEYELKEPVKTFNRNYYEIFDNIVSVSEKVRMHFVKNLFPELSSKLTTIYDIIDSTFIEKEAQAKVDDLPIETDVHLLVTIGRYNWQKGYEYAIDTAKELKSRGVPFKWIGIGSGPLQEQLMQQIRANGLEEVFLLLGNRANPFPYMKACDVYVQPSRMEGFGLTIAEAKILNKPIVATNFNSIDLQIKHGENGLIADFSAKDVADKIERLINDDSLRENIISNLRKEKKGNVEEIEKFYQLLD